MWSLKSFSGTHNSVSKWICHFHSLFFLNEWEAAGYLFIIKLFLKKICNGEVSLYDSSRNWRQDSCLHHSPSCCCGSTFKIAAWAIMPTCLSSLFFLIAGWDTLGETNLASLLMWLSHMMHNPYKKLDHKRRWGFCTAGLQEEVS